MEDIAIYFEKYSLGDDRFIFKPVSIIRGTYDKQNNKFETDYGIICDSIEGEYYESDCFFHCLTSINKLKKCFGGNNSEEALLAEYFDLCRDYCYIGYFNGDEIVVKSISFDEIENFSDLETTSIELFEDEDEAKFIFNLNSIKDLRNSKDMGEVHSKLDNLIGLYSQVVGDENTEEVQENNELVTVLKPSHQLITLKELRKEVLASVVGQDKAVNDITREIMINQTSSNPRNKSHILVTGPTGTGKTEIARTISGILDLPFFEADATAYTKEGYVGKSVYSMLISLIDQTNGDVEKAQNGILAIDEIDKKVCDTDYVSGIAVLQSLYKIMDRGIIELDIGAPSMRRTLLFDTSNLTIILMGAFDDLYQGKLNAGKNQLGFNAPKIEVSTKEISLTKNDLYKGGVPPEFLGRIGDITSTSFFEVKDLVKLMTRSNISPLLLQQEYFKEAFDVDLKYTVGYTIEIANQAIKTKTNARELKPLVRNSLKYATEEFMDGRRGKVLKLTKQTAIDPKKYEILR